MLSSLSVFTLLALCLVADVRSTDESTGKLTTEDPHGGVKMGMPSKFCDNAKDYIFYDWEESSIQEYTCFKGKRPKGIEKNQRQECTEKADKPIHKCYPGYISYKDPLPTSGPHRPLWPKYGEYTFLPKQRWLHNLEHGAIVFLYHPCADPGEVARMRYVATNCLRRHVISPSKDIPEGFNFALLAWKCKLLLGVADDDAMVNFVRTRAKHGPEAVASDGQYDTALITRAKTVSTFNDDRLCPSFSMMASLLDKVKVDSKSRRDSAKVVDGKLREILPPRLKRG